MFFRKYWIPLSVFIVAIVGVSLYFLQTRLPKDPIVIITPVEPLEKPTAEEPVVEQQQPNGIFHEDGTEPLEVPVAPLVGGSPQQDAFNALPEEERQRILIAQTLEYLPKTLELEKANRDILKRGYEDALRVLQHFEALNAQRERHFIETSDIKERIARLKAKLDTSESAIYHLEKWRDEHAKK